MACTAQITIHIYLIVMKFLNSSNKPRVEIEYCKICDYGSHCLKLAETIKSSSPEATIICNKGRQGSFEVVVNDTLIYSKLRTMALPDYQEVADVVYDVSTGAEPREIKGQQPINCAIS